MTRPFDSAPPGWIAPAGLRTVALVVLTAAASWWLLGELAGVLRPLLLAVFLGYALMPYYNRLRRVLPGPVAVGLLAVATVGLLGGLGLAVYGGLLGLADELQGVRPRVTEVVADVKGWLAKVPYLGPTVEGLTLADERVTDRLARGAAQAVSSAAGTLVEAAAAGLYLSFLLLESARLPDRIRAAYPPDRAAHILRVFGRINAGIISYLRAKVLSSLLIALPVGGVLAACGVRFALVWGVLTFLCNFIPYVGSVVAYLVPVGFAAVQFGLTWPTFTAAGLLLGLHLLGAAVVEPTVLGRAVGLSPLVILAALSLWGTLWGVPGMFLAVPLTMVIKIVCDNIDGAKPVARLLGG